jgi:hypothetical protein
MDFFKTTFRSGNPESVFFRNESLNFRIRGLSPRLGFKINSNLIKPIEQIYGAEGVECE